MIHPEWGGKLLMAIGLICIVIGLLLVLKIPIPFLGKLPGDVFIKGEHYQFYFPIVTCIILSLFISLLLYIFSSWFKS
jgi:hypothetical protein